MPPKTGTYEYWSLQYSNPITNNVDQILKEIGNTDPQYRQQVLEVLTSPAAYGYNARTGRSITTDLNKNNAQALYRQVAAGDLAGLKKSVNYTQPAQAAHGTTTAPSAGGALNQLVGNQPQQQARPLPQQQMQQPVPQQSVTGYAGFDDLPANVQQILTDQESQSSEGGLSNFTSPQPSRSPSPVGFEALGGTPIGPRVGGRPGGQLTALQAAQNAIAGMEQNASGQRTRSFSSPEPLTINGTPNTSAYENWKTNYTPVAQASLKAHGIDDPKILEIMLSPKAYDWNKKTGRSIFTDAGLQGSDLNKALATKNYDIISKLIGATATGQQVPSAGTTTLPSNVPAPVEAAINHGVNMGAALTGMRGQGIVGLMKEIAKLPGVTQDMLSGISNLLEGSQAGGAGGQGGSAGGGDQSRSELYTPDQQTAMKTLLNSAVPQLTGNQYNFEPIRQRAYKEYNEKGLPGLAERFTTFGGRRGSGGFARQAAQGRADLESQLAALESQYGQQRFGQLQNMAGLGLQRSFEPHIIEKAPTSGEALTAGAVKALPALIEHAGKIGLNYLAPGSGTALDLLKK